MPSALVVGATGLVGGQITELLAAREEYDRVTVAVRRPLEASYVGIDQRLVDFGRIEVHEADLVGDHVFCALGTTRRDAGSRARFREVDLHYPRRIAEIARRNGARHFCLISAIGASARSPFFYNRVKAEAEAAVRAAGYPSGAILRPSILGGQREGRPLERVARSVMRLAPPRWRTIEAHDVALAAVRVARSEKPGWRVLESDQIRRIAHGT
jgi:uncharacterized protein YbjT (DUF2867 family)